MKKIELEIIKVEKGETTFKIKSQTHRGWDFGIDGSNRFFHRDCILDSAYFPMYDYSPMSTQFILYVRGKQSFRDNEEIRVFNSVFDQIEKGFLH